jgi:cytochrome c oxidase subunit I+III
MAAEVAGRRDRRHGRRPSASIWPLITARGVVLIVLAELVKLRWGAAVGAAIIVVGVIAWNRPHPPDMTADEEDEFEREYGVPVNAHGSVVVARWGTGLLILFVGIAFSALLLSYFYLRLENPQWPPAGIGDPPPVRTGLAAALMLASVIAVGAARRRVAADDRRGFLAGLGSSIALACAGGVLQWFDLAGLGFAWRAHAYGSIFYTLAGFVIVIAAAALIMMTMTTFWAVRGVYTARRHAPIANVVRFWEAMVAVWVIGFGTLYLAPYLT